MEPESQDTRTDGDVPPVRITSLTKKFGGFHAVRDVSLELERGEVFGYLGPNGAGKTTTLRILLGFLRPTSGSARLFGLDAWSAAPDVHRRVGYVPGDVALYDRLTGWEMLTYLGNLRGGLETGQVRLLAKRLDANLSRQLHTLSKGNRQKIAIIQALMGRPDLLVLDEPTTGLDPLVQQQVHELLREHAAAGGTALLSSHVLSEVQLVADRIGIIRSGRLVTVERLDELRRKSLHHVQVTFAQPVDPVLFAIEGVRDLDVNGVLMSCAASQDALDPLLRAITLHHVVDLSCEEASLDDTFLAFYGNGAADAS
ncbi:MAG TPA: ABC transporter ATP-binding protein [Mycobacteriales bacterium]|nr:ABC transporter ATP-binding protein [Mycobacteriales bacterium]